MSSLKVKVSSLFVGQVFYFKFELVAYSEDFFKIVLAITKPELVIARKSPRYMSFFSN